MADILLTLQDLEGLFWTTTAKMLGLDPEATGSQSKVRISWQQKGVPAWGIDEDVAFIRIGEKEDLFNLIRDYIASEHDSDNAKVSNAYTRVLDIKWVFYGPHAYDNATLVRGRLFMESYREDLTIKNVYLVPEIDSPVRAPEVWEGQWWDRADLSASFNNLVSLESIVPYLKSAEIKVNSNSASVDSSTKPLKD